MGVFGSQINKAVFLDRDGVLTRSLVRDGKGYAPRTLAEFEILPEAREACLLLKQAGYLLIVVTNQPDVGRGLVSLEVMEEMHRCLQQALPLDEILTCTDPSEAPGPRRKPAPGMLLEAAAKWSIDFRGSFIVGDRKSDIEAGEAVGCQGIFIDRQYKEAKPPRPAAICKCSLDAARWILHNY
jgi:D-glycero-D-manno-heptose 1,7-bisphosphate phosphatase